MAYQTRSDTYFGTYAGLHYFDTLREAYQAAQKDPHIWKISFKKDQQDYRWLRVRDERGQIFWSNQPLRFCFHRGVDQTRELQRLTEAQFQNWARSGILPEEGVM